ncbi:MAG: hypothetical protein HOI69_05540, partial [Gammaproteobacteria bacterium]|nr:hypothetical protein [Gammaproteobacteria bacterium]
MSEMVNQAAEADLDRSEERSEQGVDGMLEERDPSAMTLSVFGQLLEPEGIAPAQDFAESGRLICEQTPSIELR